MLNKTVEDLMLPVEKLETIPQTAYFRDALVALEHNVWGAVCIVDDSNILKGIVTEGDIRRSFVRNQSSLARLNSMPIERFMTHEPKTIGIEDSASEALQLMSKYQIVVLPVVEPIVSNKLVGLIHVQFILKELFLFSTEVV